MVAPRSSLHLSSCSSGPACESASLGQHLEGRGGLVGPEGRQASGQFSEHRMLQDLLIRINAVHTFLSYLEVYLYLVIRYLEGYCQVVAKELRQLRVPSLGLEEDPAKTI